MIAAILATYRVGNFIMPDREPGALEYVCLVATAGLILSAIVIGVRRRVMRDRWLRSRNIDPDRPAGREVSRTDSPTMNHDADRAINIGVPDRREG
jgi:hypothetical protein